MREKNCSSCHFFQHGSVGNTFGECAWNEPRPIHYQRSYGASFRMVGMGDDFGANCSAWKPHQSESATAAPISSAEALRVSTTAVLNTTLRDWKRRAAGIVGKEDPAEVATEDYVAGKRQSLLDCIGVLERIAATLQYKNKPKGKQ